MKKLKYLSNLTIIQVPINVANKQFLSKDVSNYLKKNNIKLQARSIFLQGILIDDFENIKRKSLLIKNF